MSELGEILADSKRAVFFGGAGVSTESGLPDFRSPAARRAAQEAFDASPEEVLSASFFAQDPRTFYEYLHRFLHHPEAAPNPAHRALARLEEEGILAGVVTQNIDGLHQRAGSENVWELHGTLDNYHCTECGQQASAQDAMDQIEDGAGLPLCACGGVLKPDVVLYEEALPSDALNAAAAAIAEADTLIVGGTSLIVQPAASLLGLFRGKNLVVINKEATPIDGSADLVIRGNIGEVLGSLYPED